MGAKARVKTTVLEEAARDLLSTAIIAVKASGQTIVRGHCRFCGGNRGSEDICLLCALVLHRGRLPNAVAQSKLGIERTVAQILALPERWVIDLVTGFDDDGGDVTYRSAKLIGRNLWRKHG